jgi:uncharacterized protein (TIRG00374 family)
MDARRSRWQSLLGLVITGLFLYLIFRHLDADKLWSILVTVAPVPLLASLLFLAIDFALRIYRWWIMLRVLEPDLPYHRCVWPFLVSISINNLFPFRAGDLVRVVGFRTHLRSSAASRLGTLFIERLLDLLVLLVFFFIGLSIVGFESIPQAFLRAGLWVTIAAIVATLTLLLFHKQIEMIVAGLLCSRLLSSFTLTAKLKLWSAQLFQALGMLRSIGVTLRLLGVSIIAWILEGGVFASVAMALHPAVPAQGAWFALATGTLATLIPSSPGYVGTFDYFTIMAVVAAGADRETAAAYALLVHLVLWLPLTLAGVAYFLRPRGKMLWKAARRSEAGVPIDER